jgi:PhnB protein
MPMEDVFWGDRLGQVRDPFGHTWNIASRKWILTPEEMKEREAEWIKSRKG